MFLSADLDAFEDAGRFGVARSSRLAFAKSKQGNDAAWDLLADKVCESRRVPAPVAFDEEDRRKAAE